METKYDASVANHPKTALRQFGQKYDGKKVRNSSAPYLRATPEPMYDGSVGTEPKTRPYDVSVVEIPLASCKI